MPRLNLFILLFSLLLHALTVGVSYHDRILISTLHRIESKSLIQPSSQALFEGAMSGMIDVLSEKYGDVNSRYIPPIRQERYIDDAENRYEGFGFSYQIQREEEENNVHVRFSFLDSPADKAGMESGDQILQINDTSLAGKTQEEIYALFQQDRTKPNQEGITRFTLLPFGQTEPEEIFIRPAIIRRDSVVGIGVESYRRVFSLETHPAIGYIRITSFSESTAEEFENALNNMMQDGVESFILDLRGNPGGDVVSCFAIARMLISPDSQQKKEYRSVIVTIKNSSGRQKNVCFTKKLQQCDLPMVLLIDGYSASASEILAAALQDYRRATLVGMRTFGKGVIQTVNLLPFRSGILQLTESEYRRPNGGNIHRKKNVTDSEEWGVIPDVTVSLTETEIEAIMEYQQLRSQIQSAERAAVLEQFRQQIIERSLNENHNDHQDGKTAEFSGSAPYYDVQLDAAIEILTKPSAHSLDKEGIIP